MKFLLFSGSLRKGSLNKKLLQVAGQIVTNEFKQTVQVADLQELAFPVYDGDIETEKGIPDSVKKLGQLMTEADALIIASPEYNGSISSPLKNTIDWVSRLKPVPLEKKPVLLLGASPGGFGAIRALNHAKMPFEALGVFLYPTPFALPKADQAFNEDGSLKDEALTKRLQGLIKDYLDYAKKLKG